MFKELVDNGTYHIGTATGGVGKEDKSYAYTIKQASQRNCKEIVSTTQIVGRNYIEPGGKCNCTKQCLSHKIFTKYNQSYDKYRYIKHCIT